MIDIKTIIAVLRASKLDTRVDIQAQTKRESDVLQNLLVILSRFINDYTQVSESKQARMKAGELLILVDKIKNPSQLKIRSFEEGVARKQEANKIIDDVIANIASLTSISCGGGQVIQITDPTNTKMGKFIAAHFTRIIELAEQEKPANKTVFEQVLSRGGYGSTMYEGLHQPLDRVFAKQIYSLETAEIKKILPNVPDNELETRYKDYLFATVPSVLARTLFRYSKSMSEQQSMNMLWMHATHTRDPEDASLLKEHRLYVAIKLSRAQEAVKFIAQTVSEFLSKNPKLAPYVYFKFKIRVNLGESDRADTCVCYLKLFKGIEPYANQIVTGIFNRIAQIPGEFINKLSSPVLNEIAQGVTTVDDTGIITDKGQSYTSQIGMTFFKSLMKQAGKNPQTPAEFQAIASQIIMDTIDELRKRHYKV